MHVCVSVWPVGAASAGEFRKKWTRGGEGEEWSEGVREVEGAEGSSVSLCIGFRICHQRFSHV